jgi:hypothetical protein
MRLGWSLAVLAVAFAGCVQETADVSWTRNGVGWSLRVHEATDSLEIRSAPNPPGPWSDWNVGETAYDLGVTLRSPSGTSPTLTVPRNSATGLGSLSSSPVHEGDVLRWCKFTGDRDFSFRLSNLHGGGGFSFESLDACE